MTQVKANFSYYNITDDTVYIIDESNGDTMTVTNDAENVVAFLNEQYPNKRIVYCDTDGHWDELVHTNGNFVMFEPMGTFLRDDL